MNQIRKFLVSVGLVVVGLATFAIPAGADPVPPSPYPGVFNPYGPQAQRATVVFDGATITFSNPNPVRSSLITEAKVSLLLSEYTVVADPGVSCTLDVRSTRRRFGGYYTTIVGTKCTAQSIPVGGADLHVTFVAV